MQLFELVGSIFIDDKSASQSLDNIEGKAESTERTFGSTVKSIGKGATVVAGALATAGGAMFALSVKTANTADEIDKASIKLGISTDAYQELSYALGQVGVDQGTMERSLGRLNQRLADTDSNEKYREALHNLGVATEDASGKTRDADEVFMDSIRALEGVESSSERAALAQEIFGTKTARELLPAIEAGGDSIDELREQAQELGIVMSEDSVDAGVEFADTLDTLKRTFEGLVAELGAELMPMFTDWMNVIIDNTPEIKEFIENGVEVMRDVIAEVTERVIQGYEFFVKYKDEIILITSIIVGLVATMKIFSAIMVTITAVKTAWVAVAGLATGATTALAGAMAFLTSPIGLVVLAIGAVIAVAVLLVKNWDWVKEVTEKVWNAIKDFLSTVTEFIKDMFIVVWDKIKEVTEKVWEGIKSFFKTIFEWLKDTVDKIFNGIKDVISKVWETIKKVTETIWNGIKTYFKKLFEIYKNMFKTIFNFFKDTVNKVWEAIKKVTETVWNGIKSFFQTMFDWLSGIVETIFTGIQTVISNVWEAISSLTESIWNGIQSVIDTVLGAISGIVETVTGTISSVIEGAWNAIESVTSTVWNAIQGIIDTVLDTISGIVSTVTSGISDTFSSVWGAIESATETAFNTIESLIVNPIQKARDLVGEAVDAILGFFTNLKLPRIEIPRPKLPRFSLKGEFSLRPPSVPTLDVNWYKTGGIATGASIAGIGEAGDEAIVPLEGSYMRPFASEMAKQLMVAQGSPQEKGTDSSNSVITHNIDLKNVPEGIDEDSLRNYLMTALGSKDVQREIDRINESNNRKRNRTKGR